MAWELPPPLGEALARLQGELQGQGHPTKSQISWGPGQAPSLRWVRPQGIHLTLKFLGDVGQDLVAAITGALEAAAAPLSPFPLALGRAGSFGDRRGPRVFWIGLEGDLGSLARLQGRVEEALEPLGFRPEGRPFHPHLTLARVPPEAAAQGRRLEALLAARPLPAGPAFTVQEISLMRSILGPGGAVYQRLAALPLAGRGA